MSIHAGFALALPEDQGSQRKPSRKRQRRSPSQEHQRQSRPPRGIGCWPPARRRRTCGFFCEMGVLCARGTSARANPSATKLIPNDTIQEAFFLGALSRGKTGMVHTFRIKIACEHVYVKAIHFFFSNNVKLVRASPVMTFLKT